LNLFCSQCGSQASTSSDIFCGSCGAAHNFAAPPDLIVGRPASPDHLLRPPSAATPPEFSPPRTPVQQNSIVWIAICAVAVIGFIGFIAFDRNSGNGDYTIVGSDRSVSDEFRYCGLTGYDILSETQLSVYTASVSGESDYCDGFRFGYDFAQNDGGAACSDFWATEDSALLSLFIGQGNSRDTAIGLIDAMWAVC
jgi:hypothetical protein